MASRNCWMPKRILTKRERALTPVRQFGRRSSYCLRDVGGITVYPEKRPVRKVHLGTATVLIDIHLHNPEQTTPPLLPFVAALFDHLSLFVCQMRVVVRSMTDPGLLVRRHGIYYAPRPIGAVRITTPANCIARLIRMNCKCSLAIESLGDCWCRRPDVNPHAGSYEVGSSFTPLLQPRREAQFG
jgi:hypothetical protein